ncbi:MAG TPA: LamG-like jellyroll fold domain-containing protein, partial [Candidatus Sulfotelmatobacter sp.]|nr:LamG-like jellyroll fold domain-containing protein [Candidatus Sulfotelmatobacter sp.]
PYNAALNPAKFTVEAWAYVPLFYRDYHTILSSRDDSSVGAKPSGFIFYANTNNTWQFWNGTGSGYATLSAVNTLVVTNGQWNHLVGVYDGTNKYFYVNGDLVGFAGNVSYLPNAARPLRIGGGANETQAGNYFLAGGVDEVAVFGQPLGQDRILAHYQAARGSLPPATMPPTFTVQPQNTTNHSLQTITLTAGAIGSLPLALQWYYVSPDLQTTNVLSAGTNNTLVFSPTATSHTGWYYAVATNPAGTSTSTMVYLEIRPPQAPTLVADVSAVPVYVGGTARLPVIVEGTPPISYQWRSNAVNLVGETNTSLVISNAQVAYGTVRYSLVLSNALGVTTSAEGSLNVLTAPASTYAAVITNLQPMAYWRLGEDAGSFAYDYWQGNNGLYQNAIPNMPPGALADDDDGACLFSGTGSRVLVSNTLAFSFTGTNAFTLVTWAQPNTLTGIQRLFSNRTTSPANGGFGLGFRDASRIRFTAFGVADVDSSVGSFTMGQWYHIAVVRNGTGVQFYIDGVLKNTGTLANIIASSAYLQLGGNPTGSEYFTGIMDEAAVFNRALSAAEIAALYAGRYGALVAPSIVQDPTSNRLYAGGTARFGVVASGSQPLAYQWKANNVAIAGATNAELVLPSVTLAQNGVNYSVTVANRAGTVTSASAPLTVLAAYGYQAEVASDRPVAHWRLNETAGPTAYDQRGAHNGSAASIYSFGQPGALKDDADAAYGFDGMSTKVEVPYSADLNPATFSVECWARVTGGANTYRAAVSSRDFNQGYVLYAGVANQWQFWTRAPGVAWQPQTGTPVVEGEWAHLV